MSTKTFLLSALVALTEARFSQEQIPCPAIAALTSFGQPGQAGTLSGGCPGSLLAAADPCQKLTLADQIVTELGTDPQVIAAAAGLVAAEQNFNPFVVSIPSICDDASLPATAQLRGIVPLVDPAVTGSDVENANSKTSLTTPFNAAGLSVAGVMKAQGFSNFTAKDTSGASGAAAGSATVAASSAAATTAAASTASSVAVGCGAAPATTTAAAATTAASTAAAASGSTAAASGSTAGAGAVTNAVTGNFAGFQASSLGISFGTCTPTVKFEAGLNGRSATEFTFQAQDPVVNKGQEEALNPTIIFNRICDQLVNVCGLAAGDEGHTLCETQKAALGGGTRNAALADSWNAALGFAGTNTNPDNAPQTGLVGHT